MQTKCPPKKNNYRARYAMIVVVGPSFVVRLVVISWKLNKIDLQLLWNTIRKLASLIQLLHSSGEWWDIRV